MGLLGCGVCWRFAACSLGLVLIDYSRCRRLGTLGAGPVTASSHQFLQNHIPIMLNRSAFANLPATFFRTTSQPAACRRLVSGFASGLGPGVNAVISCLRFDLRRTSEMFVEVGWVEVMENPRAAAFVILRSTPGRLRQRVRDRPRVDQVVTGARFFEGGRRGLPRRFGFVEPRDAGCLGFSQCSSPAGRTSRRLT